MFEITFTPRTGKPYSCTPPTETATPAAAIAAAAIGFSSWAQVVNKVTEEEILDGLLSGSIEIAVAVK